MPCWRFFLSEGGAGIGRSDAGVSRTALAARQASLNRAGSQPIADGLFFHAAPDSAYCRWRHIDAIAILPQWRRITDRRARAGLGAGVMVHGLLVASMDLNRHNRELFPKPLI
ncbi:hypothetical protein PO883_27050 [Massilia sp. DJPM01]|uniref:hypothetical protein n=1 Tax=Massilia sp. DJPM01 TaxID=3024404 RepID=UPI00259E857A|nr:hypothetical protein [Massilia sp. DJPM01]MDM5180845.1 hypothetical protein [Massilia sp. DJPM01]